jgi:hypothetical protein
MATSKKSSKVVDMKKARNKSKSKGKGKGKSKVKGKNKKEQAQAKPSETQQGVSLTDFLLGEFRGHSVAARMLGRAIAEAQQDIQTLQAEIQTQADKHTEEELQELAKQSDQAGNMIRQWNTQLRERAGMLWATQKILATVDSRYAHGPQLPGLPSIREMPDLTGLDPITVEQLQEQQRVAEEQRKKEEAERLEQVKKEQEEKKSKSKKKKKAKKEEDDDDPDEVDEEVIDEEDVSDEDEVDEDEVDEDEVDEDEVDEDEVDEDDDDEED